MKWLREGDRKRSKRELERLLNYWQDKLGMKDWAFRIERARTMDEACFILKSNRFGILRCSCERDLVYELLNALFFRRNWVIEKCLDSRKPVEKGFLGFLKRRRSRLSGNVDRETIGMLQEVYIFQLTNALLRLKYSNSK
jgi:hypothetical protein